MREEIFRETKDAIAELLQKNNRNFDKIITKDTVLRDNLGLDSIDLVVLQIEIEDRCNIRFNPLKDDFQEIFYSIGTLCEFLEKKIGENNDRQE